MQVLDDSDQEDVQQLIKEEVDAWRGLGAPIFYLHRTVRTGHKAGNLQNGMEDASAKDCEFVAILDADFVPASDYLRRTVSQFEGQPKLALVQVRLGHAACVFSGFFDCSNFLEGLTVAIGSASASSVDMVISFL
jgi:cellulose synthase/poly-beta-1,6-N-acetylglucosamine synthase-like glycosyltransferase